METNPCLPQDLRHGLKHSSHPAVSPPSPQSPFTPLPKSLPPEAFPGHRMTSVSSSNVPKFSFATVITLYQVTVYVIIFSLDDKLLGRRDLE